MLSVFIFGQPFEGLSYPFLDFGQPFKFFAIRLSGYGIRLNARVSRLLSVYNRFSRPFNRKALVSVFPWRVTHRFQLMVTLFGLQALPQCNYSYNNILSAKVLKQLYTTQEGIGEIKNNPPVCKRLEVSSQTL